MKPIAPTPEFVPVPALGGEPKVITVVEGQQYECRTDAEVIVALEGTPILVRYPCVYVGEVGGSSMGAGQGHPFTKQVPVVVTPQTSQLSFIADVACNVWLAQVVFASPSKCESTPGGAGCGCGCRACGGGCACKG